MPKNSKSVNRFNYVVCYPIQSLFDDYYKYILNNLGKYLYPPWMLLEKWLTSVAASAHRASAIARR